MQTYQKYLVAILVLIVIFSICVFTLGFMVFLVVRTGQNTQEREVKPNIVVSPLASNRSATEIMEGFYRNEKVGSPSPSSFQWEGNWQAKITQISDRTDNSISLDTLETPQITLTIQRVSQNKFALTSSLSHEAITLVGNNKLDSLQPHKIHLVSNSEGHILGDFVRGNLQIKMLAERGN